MRKSLCLLLAILLACLSSFPVLSGARAETGELTVMMYICGADLESDEGEASGDISEMIASGIGYSSSVSVLLATGGSTRWQQYGISSRSVQYYRLQGDRPVLLQDAGRKNMGDAATLSGFLRFALSAAPARRYVLVLWDHGGGPVYGLCNDANYQDDSLSLSELRSGLMEGLGGVSLDIIGFDCCLMNCVDLCADLNGIAKYSVLSQELVSGTGLNYDAWMEPLVSNPALSTERIAMSMAETYVTENAGGRNAGTATMSVIDSAQMPAVMNAANAFSASLASLAQTSLSSIVRLRSQLTSFGEFMDYDASDLVDIEDMCNAFSALLPGESANLKQAAQQAVCYNCTTSDISAYAHGLSFFLPFRTAGSDSREILSHYGSLTDSYANLAVTLASQVSSSGYAMSASSYMPSNFYSCDSSYGSGSCSGSFCDIWDGYYGNSCTFDDAYNACGGDIWGGLNTSNGSIWDGYSSSSGIWSGYELNPETAAPTGAGGIWAGMEEPTHPPQPTQPPQPTAPAPQSSASSALNSIWEGLLNTGEDYYQPGEVNQNVQAGISESVSPEDMVDAASTYFSSATLTTQMIYSIQLNRNDLDHLSAASGVLSRREGDEVIRLGNLGQTTIDWSTGLVFSMFDGAWPMLGGQMVRAEILYSDEDGTVRFVIPARVNGIRMYLLGKRTGDGETVLLGATQGYDENGFAIRGAIPLETGMTIQPLFTAVSPDGSEREYEGAALAVPEGGLTLTWEQVPAGSYAYCFGLTDLSGQVHYTDSAPLHF